MEIRKTAYKDIVKFYDLDILGRYKVSSVLRLAAEAAGYDYTVKGLTHDFLLEKNMVFLVSQVSFKIYNSPKEQENVTVYTWENGKKGALFLRGFEILDSENNLLMQGITGWILLNTVTKTLILPNKFPYPQLQLDEKFECLPVTKLKIPPENLKKLGERRIRMSDLDANHHTYNAVYADIVLDFFPKEFFGRSPANFRINYIKETKLGDDIQIFAEISLEKFACVGMVEDKVVFEAEFIYNT